MGSKLNTAFTYGIAPTRVAIETENAIKEGYRLIVHQGGTRCFASGTPVSTPHGSKPIKTIQIGDIVNSHPAPQRVINVIESVNTKKTVKVKLKNGKDFTCTEDHKFFYKGDWISIKHILSLWNESKKL